MRIELIAADSLGTRSMATSVEAGNLKIFIDPAAALGPSRYGMPPHRIEIERLQQHWSEIKRKAVKADVLIITHYHYDHHNPFEPEIFKGKHVIIKNPKENINKSQKERASFFLEGIKKLAKKVATADGKSFNFEGVKIICSSPVFHGTSSKLGYVVEVAVEEGEEKFLFTSDVEGPSIGEQAEFIIGQNPSTLYLDGPLSYMLGYRYSHEALDISIKNMVRIIEETRIKHFIVDHHLLRDLNWKERIKEVFRAAKKRKVNLTTAAGFMGKEIETLEARRRELYAQLR